MKRQRMEFLAEAEDILSAMDRDIMGLAIGVRAGTIEPALLNKIFRSAHTLKGLASIFEFNEITEVSHALEDKLDLLRLGRLVLCEDCLEAIIRAQGLLARIVCARSGEAFRSEAAAVIVALGKGREVQSDTADWSLKDEICSALTEHESFRLDENIKAGKRLFVVSVGFKASEFESGHSAFTAAAGKLGDIIATLPSAKKESSLLSFEILIATSQAEQEVRRCLCDFKGITCQELAVGRGEGQDIAAGSLGASVVKRGGTSAASMHRDARTIRVDVKKIERLMNSVDEMRKLREDLRRLYEISGGMVSPLDCSGEIKKIDSSFENALITLKENVLAVKMVPLGRLFKRFEPYIKRLAYECRKDIEVVTYGGETELDRTIVEELADPLMHIIRNVIDHAIESPEARKMSGKACAGSVTLSAYHEGGHVAIEVKDDGIGIDPEVLCERAISKGLIDKDKARSLARSEKLNLIFLPGFTTTDKISVTSGRGVGLDVVRENVALLNGLVEIETVHGKGTRFILTIPVTQSMIGALVCEEGGNTLAVPGNRIIEIVSLTDNASLNDGFISIDNVRMRAIRPSSLFHHEERTSAALRYAIVTSTGRERLCLLVDSVMDEINILIRPLPLGHKISGVMGLTEADNNDAVLVLDVCGILESLSTRMRGSSQLKPLV